jgi:hypothetical protein
LANRRPQLIGLLLQLPEVFRLLGEIATDLRDLAFDSIRQIGGPAPVPSPLPAT